MALPLPDPGGRLAADGPLLLKYLSSMYTGQADDHCCLLAPAQQLPAQQGCSPRLLAVCGTCHMTVRTLLGVLKGGQCDTRVHSSSRPVMDKRTQASEEHTARPLPKASLA